MKRLWEYLRQYRLGVLLLALWAALFTLIFRLYHLPLEATGYAALLCLAASAPLVIRHFLHFCRRQQQLEALSRDIQLLERGLPEADHPLEASYQALVMALHEALAAAQTENDRRQQALVDQYTLWVHQIKTPIAAMRLLLQTDDRAESHALQAELFKIEQYVQMVLACLRSSGSSTDYVIEHYDLETLVHQAVRKYGPLFIRKRIQLQLDPIHAQVLTDEKWLVFVMEQILSNALKYTPEGGVIHIHMPQEAVLVIEDTGIGIAPEDVPRVFEPNYTGYNGRRDKKATGLGLSLSRQIMTRLGHRITLTSQLGQGTQVQLDLRRKLLIPN